MGGFAARAAACLGRFHDTFGQAVVYARGAATVALTAVAGDEARQYDAVTGEALVEGVRRAFVFPAAGFSLFPPAVGDTVTDAAGTVYEVVPLANLPPWEWADPDRLTLRVFGRECAGS